MCVCVFLCVCVPVVCCQNQQKELKNCLQFLFFFAYRTTKHTEHASHLGLTIDKKKAPPPEEACAFSAFIISVVVCDPTLQ